MRVRRFVYSDGKRVVELIVPWGEGMDIVPPPTVVLDQMIIPGRFATKRFRYKGERA